MKYFEIMSIKSTTIRYGLASVAIAIIVIVLSMAIAPPVLIRTSTSQSINSSISSSTSNANSATQSLIVQLTDPPSVPTGTLSLNLSYDGVQLFVANSYSSSWLETNSTGTVDLMRLVNISQTIAVAPVPTTAIIDEIRFGIERVTINVNGTTYNVSTPYAVLTVPIAGVTRVQNLSAMLLELNPRVLEVPSGNIYALNTFILIPGASAILRSRLCVKLGEARIGADSALSDSYISRLEDAEGNATVMFSSLSVDGNTTEFSITLRNTGNISVALEAVSIQGVFNSTSLSYNTTSCQSATSSDGGGDGTFPSCTEVEHEVEISNELVFVPNGTSLLPIAGDFQNNGSLVLSAGNNYTLNFTGIITVSQGDQGSNHLIQLYPIRNMSYIVKAEFTNDVETLIAVTAT